MIQDNNGDVSIIDCAIRDKEIRESVPATLLDCPFCGTAPKRSAEGNIYRVECPECVSVGFYNHVRLGCMADGRWNSRTGG